MRNTRLFSNQWTFPEPVIGYAIEPKTQADVDKLGMAIAKLVEEDPTLKVHTDEETGQTILEEWVSFTLTLSWIDEKRIQS